MGNGKSKVPLKFLDFKKVFTFSRFVLFLSDGQGFCSRSRLELNLMFMFIRSLCDMEKIEFGGNS